MLSDEATGYLHPAAMSYFLRSLRTPDAQKEIGQVWISKCMEAGHEGSMCADALLEFLAP